LGIRSRAWFFFAGMPRVSAVVRQQLFLSLDGVAALQSLLAQQQGSRAQIQEFNDPKSLVSFILASLT
jgi:hypothetical protein